MLACRRHALRSASRIAALVLAWAPFAGAGTEPAPATIQFNRDIRPILSDKCFSCHGPDKSKRKADLRLDDPAEATAETPSGTRAIVPGDLEQSELVVRITSDEATLRMPPPNSGKALTPAEVELLQAWVRQGATFQAHWAFIPPTRPPVPEVSTPDWCRGTIDRYVLARLDREHLKPSPEADRTTLLRRLSLDLTGLPPTIEELDAFLADSRPGAYDRQVRRLLDSPHYGERWGRIWLDAARYADSDGYEKDKPRQVWFYRDWVVRSLNNDLPYDRFILEQIAGDLLPGATQDQKVATGFLRNSMINEEGGVDPEQFRMEAMFDRMDAVGTAVLGLTVRCAQCHTHKFDPITHDDYYRMFACLNDSYEGSITVYTPEQQARRDEILDRTREIEDRLRSEAPDWRDRMRSWEAEARANPTNWTVVHPELDTSGGQKHTLLEDGSILASGYAPTKHTTEFTARVDVPTITAVRLELLNDPDLPHGGPGRSIQGLSALTEFRLSVAPADHPDQAKDVKVVRATADVNPAETPLLPIFDDKSKKTRVTGPVAYAIDGKDETAWGIDNGPGRRNVPRKAVFVLEQPISIPAGAVLTFKLTQNHGGWNSDDNQNHNLGRFRLSITDAADPVADPLPAVVRALVDSARERGPVEDALLFGYWRTTVPEWESANAEIEDLWKTHPEGTSQLVMQHREGGRPTSLLDRGDFLKPLHPVAPGVPAFLNGVAFEPAGGSVETPARLAFARWLVDAKTPTTPRALVNRVWQAYFGTGLVETPEDFGAQGATPSHPELLEWLSADFVERGWSLKELHRTIVSSATYRQSSHVTPELQARDPFNRLLARGPRVRLDAEQVRDLALAASGLLDPTLGGPSVQPPAPAFLFEPPTSYGPKVWTEAKGPERYRRALYTFRFRSVPYPALQAFDAPNGDIACVRRSRSNTPMQALTGLNEPLFLESARALARRALARGGPDDLARLRYAFRLVTARTPSDSETQELHGLLERQSRRFETPDAKPWDLAADDPEHPPALPDGATPAQAAAWTTVARVLLNLDETITKE